MNFACFTLEESDASISSINNVTIAKTFLNSVEDREAQSPTFLQI